MLSGHKTPRFSARGNRILNAFLPNGMILIENKIPPIFLQLQLKVDSFQTIVNANFQTIMFLIGPRKIFAKKWINRHKISCKMKVQCLVLNLLIRTGI